METATEKTFATATHLGALTQYFIPFGNFLFPIIIWSSKKNQSEYIDFHGKQIINFQLSILLYSIIMGVVAIPIFIYTFFKNIPFVEFINNHHYKLTELNIGEDTGFITTALITAFLFVCLKIAEFFLIINGAIKASNGEKYEYPLTIHFIKETK